VITLTTELEETNKQLKRIADALENMMRQGLPK